MVFPGASHNRFEHRWARGLRTTCAAGRGCRPARGGAGGARGARALHAGAGAAPRGKPRGRRCCAVSSAKRVFCIAAWAWRTWPTAVQVLTRLPLTTASTTCQNAFLHLFATHALQPGRGAPGLQVFDPPAQRVSRRAGGGAPRPAPGALRLRSRVGSQTEGQDWVQGSAASRTEQVVLRRNPLHACCHPQLSHNCHPPSCDCAARGRWSWRGYATTWGTAPSPTYSTASCCGAWASPTGEAAAGARRGRSRVAPLHSLRLRLRLPRREHEGMSTRLASHPSRPCHQPRLPRSAPQGARGHERAHAGAHR